MPLFGAGPAKNRPSISVIAFTRATANWRPNTSYLKRASQRPEVPHLPEEAYFWHIRAWQTGSMLPARKAG